jgi:exonuclease III
MKIASWNIERPKKDNNHYIVDLSNDTNPDILFLTIKQK